MAEATLIYRYYIIKTPVMDNKASLQLNATDGESIINPKGPKPPSFKNDDSEPTEGEKSEQGASEDSVAFGGAIKNPISTPSAPGIA